MKAIILAAGYGNRMKPLTDNEHKTLLKINGKATLSRIVSGLIDNHVKDIVIVTGYRHDDIVNFLTDEYKSIDFQFVYNDQYRTTNNIFSMALAFDNVDIDDDVILIESDLIYEPTVIERIIHSEYKNVALVCKYHSGLDGTVVKLKGETIVDVIPPHRQGPNFDFSYKFKTQNIY